MENYELDLTDWEKSVGKIVSSVARLEGELLLKYETHKSLSRTSYFKTDDTLGKRFKVVKELYTSECGTYPQSEKLFNQFKDLVALRNLVAHNPVYYEGDGFRITNGQSKSKFLTLNQISDLAKTLFPLASAIRVV
ncbi:hypothetical protein [Vibrio parahaemolyticus]|uniref:hypothetical protein n=1 Tax=Vibrio parahaemolyticus TaxID=670 RepID=UPI0004D581DE|nr:hypothetical protein [Vibrio parahaemolyticus]OQU49821.1 hypothetical protein EM74_009910 [Vibrio parahaemolyticus]